MKKVLKVILGILLSIVIVIGSLYGAFIYMIKYHVETVDKNSYNGYEVVMQSVGSPLFFSSADGRLLLKKMEKQSIRLTLYYQMMVEVFVKKYGVLAGIRIM